GGGSCSLSLGWDLPVAGMVLGVASERSYRSPDSSLGALTYRLGARFRSSRLVTCGPVFSVPSSVPDPRWNSAHRQSDRKGGPEIRLQKSSLGEFPER